MNETIKRCTRCLLPGSYPGIKFNKKGVCNFCLEFKQRSLLGEELFLEKIKSKIRDKFDCLVGISGGKDSCYVAYLAKERFNLRVLAVCYDFPFLCELARKNVKNVCDTLKIDLIIKKSKRNVEYNLLQNHLMSTAATGTSWGQCLFCHYGIDAILYNVAKENKIPFILSGVTNSELWWNPGNRIVMLLKRIKKLGLIEKAKFIYYQLKAYFCLVNQRREFKLPSNSCFNAYKKPKKPLNGPEFVNVFDYIKWDHKIIEDTLVERTGWVKPDRSLSWRYDCILEPMLDYTYKREFGISSAGLYLSALIRSGQIERDEALEIIGQNEDEEYLRKAAQHVFNYLEIPLRSQNAFFNAQ